MAGAVAGGAWGVRGVAAPTGGERATAAGDAAGARGQHGQSRAVGGDVVLRLPAAAGDRAGGSDARSATQWPRRLAAVPGGDRQGLGACSARAAAGRAARSAGVVAGAGGADRGRPEQAAGPAAVRLVVHDGDADRAGAGAAPRGCAAVEA